ncbi:hypothetical protein B0H19DRAFT_449015 [Mycena capillaripes]|nr:hypothetical protein B0H19DRAFT_449015 [Mycena capillaripes]
MRSLALTRSLACFFRFSSTSRNRACSAPAEYSLPSFSSRTAFSSAVSTVQNEVIFVFGATAGCAGGTGWDGCVDRNGCAASLSSSSVLSTSSRSGMLPLAADSLPDSSSSESEMSWSAGRSLKDSESIAVSLVEVEVVKKVEDWEWESSWLICVCDSGGWEHRPRGPTDTRERYPRQLALPRRSRSQILYHIHLVLRGEYAYQKHRAWRSEGRKSDAVQI